MWTDLTDPGPGTPAASPAVPLRYKILAALAYAATESRRAGDTALADDWDDAYHQVARGSAAWCDLTTALHAGMN